MCTLLGLDSSLLKTSQESWLEEERREHVGSFVRLGLGRPPCLIDIPGGHRQEGSHNQKREREKDLGSTFIITRVLCST